jgi:hypothetical protein
VSHGRPNRTTDEWAALLHPLAGEALESYDLDVIELSLSVSCA